MFERLRQMLIKEFLQVFRDPRMRMVIFVIPCFQTLVIGYAVTTDVTHVPTVVYDLDHSEDSRALIDRFAASRYFDVVANVDNPRDAEQFILRDEATTILHVDHGFSEDLRAGRTARLQVIVDGTDSNTAGIVLAYASRIATAASEDILVERMGRIAGLHRTPAVVDLRTRAWFNANLESRMFYVPGVLAIVVTLVTLLLTSMAVVREKEIGTMEQIIVSPISPGEFILGKTIPFAAIGMFDALAVTAVGVFWFGVPIHGSLLLLFLGVALYLMTTISQTQQQAMMTTFFFFFPAMLLSGFAFPVENMPTVVQWLTVLNPMRHFLVIVRGVFLKGVGIEAIRFELLMLAAIGATTLWLATRRFRKTMA
jgi:ABC-2 type transport system permease protein